MKQRGEKRWENLWLPATVDWSYRANIFELGSRSDPASWFIEEPYSIFWLAIVNWQVFCYWLLVSQFSWHLYHSMIVRLTSPATRGCLLFLHSERKPLGPGYQYRSYMGTCMCCWVESCLSLKCDCCLERGKNPETTINEVWAKTAHCWDNKLIQKMTLQIIINHNKGEKGGLQPYLGGQCNYISDLRWSFDTIFTVKRGIKLVNLESDKG